MIVPKVKVLIDLCPLYWGYETVKEEINMLPALENLPISFCDQ